MSRTRIIIGLATLLALAAVLVGLSCFQRSPAPTGTVGTPSNGLTQSSSAGAVTVQARWLGKEGGSLTFEVAMDTHSVPLSQYDLAKLARLRDSQGGEYAPTAWTAPSGDHHRKGMLSFPLPEAVAQGGAAYVEIVVRDIAGIPQRVLRWQLGA